VTRLDCELKAISHHNQTGRNEIPKGIRKLKLIHLREKLELMSIN